MHFLTNLTAAIFTNNFQARDSQNSVRITSESQHAHSLAADVLYGYTHCDSYVLTLFIVVERYSMIPRKHVGDIMCV